MEANQDAWVNCETEALSWVLNCMGGSRIVLHRITRQRLYSTYKRYYTTSIIENWSWLTRPKAGLHTFSLPRIHDQNLFYLNGGSEEKKLSYSRSIKSLWMRLHLSSCYSSSPLLTTWYSPLKSFILSTILRTKMVFVLKSIVLATMLAAAQALPSPAPASLGLEKRVS